MRALVHGSAAVAVIALAGALATSALGSDTLGSVAVSVQNTAKLKAKHAWKTSGPGGDGKLDFFPFLTFSPDEFGTQVSGVVRVNAEGASDQFVSLSVHAGKGSRNSATRSRTKIGKRDGALGRSFGAVLSDLVYSLDLSHPDATGDTFAKPIGVIDGAVDITASSAKLDIKLRSDGRSADVKLKAKYKGTVIFGPHAGKKVRGTIQLVAKEAQPET